jgi:hypothetical protein
MPTSTVVDPGVAELRAIQEFMAEALFRPLGRGDRMQRTWKDGRPMATVTGSVIKPNDRLTSFERLEIYNRVYWFRVLDCLYDDFPAVEAIIGQRRFHRLITAFLAEFPSESYTLRDLGERFPRYIQEHPELTAPHTFLAHEASIFEWAQVIAFDSEAKPGLNVDTFLGVDPTALRIGLQPYLTLLQLEHPWDDFILALKKHAEVRDTNSNTMAEATERKPLRRPRRPRPQRIQVAVHRHNNFLYYKRLEPAAFAILQALQSGETLADACVCGAELAPAEPPFGEVLQRWFHDWAALGWMCARVEGVS